MAEGQGDFTFLHQGMIDFQFFIDVSAQEYSAYRRRSFRKCD